MVLFVSLFVCFFFKPKCIVNKWAFGLFVLMPVERKVLGFVEQLGLICR